MNMRIAGAQLPVTRNVAANVEQIRKAIEFARGQKADILLTPEGSLSGYTHEFDPAVVAVALEEVTRTASQAGVGLALGTCFVEPEDGQCYNQLRFYAPDGAYLGFHSKILTCGTLDDPPQGEINHYATTPLRTFEYMGVTVGGLICNDMWATPFATPGPDPHLLQQLSRMGAQVVFHAVNGGRGQSNVLQTIWNYHESNLRLRAMAGRVWVATVDNAYPTDQRCSAPSGLIDPNGDWSCRTEDTGAQHFAHTVELA